MQHEQRPDDPLTPEPATVVPIRQRVVPRGVILGMLFLVYTLNYLDRQIVGILALPIKEDLGLSDSQLGLMGGLAFAIFYSALGIPIARLADRYSRKWIETAALVLWSGFTALCGFATGFMSLFLARLGVGIGEAGGAAPAFSMIADYYPPTQRARALAIMTLGLPVGSALGLFIGGYLAQAYGWRTAFIVLGVAGLAIAPVFALLVREPERGATETRPPTITPAGPAGLVTLADVIRTVAAQPSFILIALGSATASMLTYGLGFWLPSFISRTHGLDIAQTSQFLGAIAISGGVVGILVGGFLSDHIGKRDRRAYALIPAVAFLLAFPALLVAINLQSLIWVFLLLLIPQFMGYVWAGPSVAIIQNISPPHMRTTASALYLFIVNLVGLGVGTTAFGVISDLFAESYGGESLRLSITVCAVLLYPVTAALYFMASRRIRDDWRPDLRTTGLDIK